MDLFNSLIRDTQAMLDKGLPKVWDYSERDCWTDLGSSELVLQKDAAYELGASGKGSANYVLFSSSPELVSKDQILHHLWIAVVVSSDRYRQWLLALIPFRRILHHL